MALVRFAAEMDEGDIHQVTVFIWLQLVIALIDDMWLKGIINRGGGFQNEEFLGCFSNLLREIIVSKLLCVE